MAKITPTFFGEIKDGQIVYEKPERRDYYIKNLKNGLRVVELLKPAKKPRSNNQNKYYWGVVLEIIANEIGISPEEAHDLMKIQFLKKHINEKLWTVKSTATLNTLAFEEYLDNVRRFASMELNCIIPLPNEIDFI